MQPASKIKTWDPHSIDDMLNEPPTKIQAIEIPQGESDDEYEAVPKLEKKKSPERRALVEPIPIAIETLAPTEADNPTLEHITAPDATDDDWLRGRTNRLLDLMDPEDIPAGQSVDQGLPARKDSAPTAESNDNVQVPDNIEEPPQAEAEWEGIDDEEVDPVIESIKTNGRLFVRNLPYSATEDDLRQHFAPYGTLEEVKSLLSFRLPHCFMMNIQIGTAYAQAYDVNWTNILVDASCFLKD